jgi:putative PIN family toxin of toxin-antitoxin system
MKTTSAEIPTAETQQKIVIDTNVWLSAFISHGFSYRAVDYCITVHKVYCCKFIIEEIKRNLIKKFKVSKEIALKDCDFVYKHTTLVEYTKNEIPNICKDNDDNHILACCQKAEADWLITGDSHLLELKKYTLQTSKHKETKIVTPREFLNMVLKLKQK